MLCNAVFTGLLAFREIILKHKVHFFGGLMASCYVCSVKRVTWPGG